MQVSQQIINPGTYVLIVACARHRSRVAGVGRRSERSSVIPRSTSHRIVEFLGQRGEVLAHPQRPSRLLNTGPDLKQNFSAHGAFRKALLISAARTSMLYRAVMRKRMRTNSRETTES